MHRAYITSKCIAAIGLLSLGFIFTVPLLLQPAPVFAGGGLTAATGIQLTAEVPWSPWGLLQKVLERLATLLKARLIRIIQQKVLSTFQKIANICPPYLTYKGTDVCRQVVGNWSNFFSDVVANSDTQLANQIGNSDLPRDWKGALIAGLQPASVTYRGQPASNIWSSFLDSLNPQNNFLGQAIITAERKQAQAQANLQAAQSEALAGRGIVGDYECAQYGPANGPFADCVAYRLKTPGAIKQEVLAEVTLGDFKLTYTAQQFQDLIDSFLNPLLDQLLGPLNAGLFGNLSFSAPPTPVNQCAGLTGDALTLCQQSQQEERGIRPVSMTFSASPLTVTQGSQTTLSWQASNTQNCVATGDWMGDRSTQGTESITPASASSEEAITCDDTQGAVAIVVVSTSTCVTSGGEEGGRGVLGCATQQAGGSQKITLTATPSAIHPDTGEFTVLSWSTSGDSTSCSASSSDGSWGGAKKTEGQDVVTQTNTSPALRPVTYALSCGSVKASVTVQELSSTGGTQPPSIPPPPGETPSPEISPPPSLPGLPE